MIAIWNITYDGFAPARKLADRHYSRQKPGTPLFVGPGEKLVLITPDYKALFCWRKCLFRMDGQEGVECTLFRNEGGELSSELIREACRWAWERWRGVRLFTYVDSRKIKSQNPGYCFLKAGWQRCGQSKNGLILFEQMDVDATPPYKLVEQLSLFA